MSSFKPPATGSWSPWGPIEEVTKLAPGVWSIATPGHGGLRLAPWTNRRVHWLWREVGGWYEEDVAWAIPAATFCGWGDEVMYEAAIRLVLEDEELSHQTLLVFGSRKWVTTPDLVLGDLVRWVPKVDTEHVTEGDNFRIYSSFDPLTKREVFTRTVDRPELGTNALCTVVSSPRYVEGETCYELLSATSKVTVSRSYLEKVQP